MKIAPTDTTIGAAATQIVRGKRQGFLGPVPNVLDICPDCKASLEEWMKAGKS